MADWMWITLGYGVAYSAIAVYLGVLARRWARRAPRTEGAG